MAERDARSIAELRTQAETARTLASAAYEAARQHLARSRERRRESDAAALQARKPPATASARLDNQLLHAAQRAHHWQAGYELRCQEADAALEANAALELAWSEANRRAALLHGALLMAVARLEGRADP